MRTSILAVLTALLFTASAQAGSPVIAIDPSPDARNPRVAVAPDGTAHIAWEFNGDGPDAVRYCRLPRGASACDATMSFTPDGLETFHAPSVLVREGGRIQVVVDRCCGGGGATPVHLYESEDGGTSWGTARTIGDIEIVQAIAGPGANAVTGVEAGTYSPKPIAVQVMATDAAQTTAAAALEDGPDRKFPGGVGLLDSATPILAYTDLKDTFLRRFDSTKSGYNDGANWLPSISIPGENEPILVSGSAGTYVMTHDEIGDDPLKDAHLVRRVSEADGSLSAPVLASDIGPPIRTTFSADDGGGLLSLWTIASSGDPAPIRAAFSPTGAAFNRSGTLVDAATPFTLEAAAAADHGGFVVWDNNSGGINAAAIPVGGPPSGPPPKPAPGATPTPTPTPEPDPVACQRKVLKDGITAIAKGGCWTDLGGNRWAFDGTVDLNGIVFAAPAGAKSGVRVDLGKQLITSPAGTTKSAGSVVLSTRETSWDFTSTSKQTFTKLETAGPGGKAIQLLGFRVTGDATITFVKDAVTVVPNLLLPAPFDTITAQTTLTANAKTGLKLDGARIFLASATIGPFGVKNLDVRFKSGLSTFDGTADLLLPPEGGPLGVKIGFVDGTLKYLILGPYSGPPLPIALTTGLWLNKVDVGYDGSDGFEIAGGGELGIPAASGPITVDALITSGNGFRFRIPKGANHAVLSLGGKLKFFGLTVGGAAATFDTRGLFNTNVDLDLGVRDVVGLFGTVTGDINLPQASFYFNGTIQACVLVCTGIDATASSIGVAVCPSLTFGIDPLSFEIVFLVGYKWQGGLDVGAGCDNGSYKPTTPGPPSASDPVKLAGNGKITLEPNLPGVSDQKIRTFSLEVKGAGGVPGIRIAREDGTVLVASDPANPLKPVQGENIVVVPNPGTNAARVTILQTQESDQIAGTLSITQSGGSPIAFRVAGNPGDGRASAAQAVSGIAFARSYPATGVQATLGGKGRRRTVAVSATNLGASERSVELVEQGADGVVKRIGITRKARATLRWRIFDGPRGRRTVTAIVRNHAGLPVSEKVVARFTAPGPALPGRPTKLRLRRSASGRLTVSWSGTAGAFQRLVVVRIADGRRLRILTKRRSVSFPGVSKREKVTATVVGLTKVGLRGRSATKRR